jgi:hypothetical protein
MDDFVHLLVMFRVKKNSVDFIMSVWHEGRTLLAPCSPSIKVVP